MGHKLREPVNGLTHLAGVLLAIIGLVVLVVSATRYGNAWHVVSFSIFGSSMILLYASSTLYHLLPLSPKGVALLRRIDHIMIFFLIAGTYTPFCLVPLRGAWGWSLFGTVWGIALAGFLIKIFWMHAPRWLSTAIYLIMGWIAVVAIYPMILSMPLGGLLWLVAGGLTYTLGAIIYGLKWPNPCPRVFGYHALWHLFVLGGTFCHFWSIYCYVTPIG
ncbi:MAG: hemolysin [Deltaproteobacteria bacterium RIFCSPLOWO2_02_FULL_50_16]|nr:MAG: hemolysin [Deltaproteobacteria bacterium RIFCSPLOWO2_02_FULL_50_16]